MNISFYLKSTIAIILITCSNVCLATDSLGHKYPSVVLVQLNSETNRITALRKAKDYKLLQEVKEDADNAAAAMKNDFRDHFKFCPVYYYMDTNAEMIRQKKFDNVLLNVDGTSAPGSGLNSNSTGYLIVYYGYPDVQEKKDNVSSGETTQRGGKGMVVLNDKYRQIAHTSPPAYAVSYHKHDANKSKYYFVSKHFDIQYVAFASDLNSKLSGGQAKDLKGTIPKKAAKN